MLALATVAVEGILPNLSRYTKEYDPVFGPIGPIPCAREETWSSSLYSLILS